LCRQAPVVCEGSSQCFANALCKQLVCLRIHGRWPYSRVIVRARSALSTRKVGTVRAKKLWRNRSPPHWQARGYSCFSRKA
jgi:hypothetical protein